MAVAQAIQVLEAPVSTLKPAEDLNKTVPKRSLESFVADGAIIGGFGGSGPWKIGGAAGFPTTWNPWNTQ